MGAGFIPRLKNEGGGRPAQQLCTRKGGPGILAMDERWEAWIRRQLVSDGQTLHVTKR